MKTTREIITENIKTITGILLNTSENETYKITSIRKIDYDTYLFKTHTRYKTTTEEYRGRIDFSCDEIKIIAKGIYRHPIITNQLLPTKKITLLSNKYINVEKTLPDGIVFSSKPKAKKLKTYIKKRIIPRTPLD